MQSSSSGSNTSDMILVIESFFLVKLEPGFLFYPPFAFHANIGFN